MNERGKRTPQPKARRPSQLRLTDDDITLPARLVHLRHLPWLAAYQRQLQTESKSENTQKSYFYGLRPLVETVLPGEDVLDESSYESLSIESLAQRMEPMNGRLDVWAHSISGLKPTPTTLESPLLGISSDGWAFSGLTTSSAPAPENAFRERSLAENLPRSWRLPKRVKTPSQRWW